MQNPSARVRLEINKGSAGKKERLDMFVLDGDQSYAIELKYKTRKLNLAHDGEEFRLSNHGAQDTGRYDFVKDIGRLERFVHAHGNNLIGYAILLTNDDLYWKEAKRSLTADAGFRIHEGRVLNGELRWTEGTGAGTMENREVGHSLTGTHTIRWADYSELKGDGPGKFRYLILEIR